jgi:hypothetical protein
VSYGEHGRFPGEWFINYKSSQQQHQHQVSTTTTSSSSSTHQQQGKGDVGEALTKFNYIEEVEQRTN